MPNLLYWGSKAVLSKVKGEVYMAFHSYRPACCESCCVTWPTKVNDRQKLLVHRDEMLIHHLCHAYQRNRGSCDLQRKRFGSTPYHCVEACKTSALSAWKEEESWECFRTWQSKVILSQAGLNPGDGLSQMK